VGNERNRPSPGNHCWDGTRRNGRLDANAVDADGHSRIQCCLVPMGDFDGARSDCRLGVWLHGRAKSDLRLELGTPVRLVGYGTKPSELFGFHIVFGRFEEPLLLKSTSKISHLSIVFI
jgi:hypothetical protein